MEVFIIQSKTYLTGRVIFRGDPGYHEARQNWNPFSDSYPLVFVFAQNHLDVSNAIIWAQENKVPLRARSGRHALEREMSQVKDGIVIDVSDMNHVRLDRENGVAFVETGGTVGQIVKSLAQKGLMFPFGDSPSVGIGGITLGGGIGPLCRSIGLISDNLIGVKMVDAQGKLLIANEEENSDLLWASRGGGGGNFGIATEYEFNLHCAPAKATTFEIVWPWEQLEQVFDAWQNWAPFVDHRLGTSLEIGGKCNGLLHASGLFLGSKAELTNLLEPITSTGTPTEVNIQNLPWRVVVNNLLPADPIPDPSSSKFSSAWVEEIWPDRAIRSMRSFLEKATGTESNFYFLNWGGAVSEIPSDKTAFFWRKPKFYTEWSASWMDPSEARKNIALVTKTRENLDPFIKGSYVNVPDFNIKDFGPTYYGRNFDRLRKVKTKYDPSNVFNYPQSIPPFNHPR
ncbi:FAD-binding oxidoreductase [Sporosarcina sp. BI001-red]|uniref:FAD-binding oxidoreductase n=1 Tax=Sporosarcina sp. BI001-red TaxID=2282866 RepID=UPI000E251253|nr:FAD-binding oxidoreductase [Sporosarcina sp. BI001-red]REB11577.1 FAD-binding oxidoreductase [Sporosarcina sp. BI001-red]